MAAVLGSPTRLSRRDAELPQGKDLDEDGNICQKEGIGRSHAMIDLTLDKNQIEKNARQCARKGIILPTYKEMANPELVSSAVKAELKSIGLNEVHSRNLFRVTWEKRE